MATMLVLKVSAEMTNKSLIDLLTMIIINEMYVNKYFSDLFSNIPQNHIESGELYSI